MSGPNQPCRISNRGDPDPAPASTASWFRKPDTAPIATMLRNACEFLRRNGGTAYSTVTDFARLRG